MANAFHIRPQAVEDLEELAEHIGRDSPQAAVRFLNAFWDGLDQLLHMPHIGRSIDELRNPRLKGLQRWGIPGFPNHLIFYIEHSGDIEVIRIFHGARDILGILEREKN